MSDKHYESVFTKQVEDNSKLVGTNGRLVEGDGDSFIIDDVFRKLDLSQGDSLLDIGCGSGDLTVNLVRRSVNLGVSLTMIDFPAVIADLKKKLMPLNLDMSRLRFIEGSFPDDELTLSSAQKFDKVLVYSVIHYSSNPKKFIQKAVSFLKENSSALLIGDIPNVNYKGRFLMSDFGRQFEAQYKNVKESDLPAYESHSHYACTTTNQNQMINDELLLWCLSFFRSGGFDVFILNQSKELPFSYSREDVLIRKY